MPSEGEMREGVITDADFAESRGEKAAQPEGDGTFPMSEEELQEPADKDADEGGEAAGEEAPEDEGGGEEEEDEPDLSKVPDLDIEYGEVDEFLRVLPERDQDLVKGVIEQVREKDREATKQALRVYHDKVAPAVEFKEKFGSWDDALTYVAQDESLQEKVAMVIQEHISGAPARIPGPDGSVAVPAAQNAAAAPAPAQSGGTAPVSFDIPEEIRGKLKSEAEEKGVDGDVFDVLSKTVAAQVQSLAKPLSDTIVGQLNQVLGSYSGRLSVIEGAALEQRMSAQEREVLTEFGDMARPYIEKTAERAGKKFSKVDLERARAYREDGETISIRTATRNLLHKEGKLRPAMAGVRLSGSGTENAGTLRGRKAQSGRPPAREPAAPQIRPDMSASEMRRILPRE